MVLVLDRCQIRPYCGRRKRGIMVEVADDMVSVLLLFVPFYLRPALRSYSNEASYSSQDLMFGVLAAMPSRIRSLCGVGSRAAESQRWDSPAATWVAGCGWIGAVGVGRCQKSDVVPFCGSIGQSDDLQSNLTQKIVASVPHKKVDEVRWDTGWMVLRDNMVFAARVFIPYRVSSRLFIYDLNFGSLFRSEFFDLSGTICLSANHCGSCGSISDFARP